jgi:hypothetical protein
MRLVRHTSVGILLGVFYLSFALGSASATKQRPGKLIGVLLDANDGRLPPAIVIVQGEKFKRHLKSDGVGYLQVNPGFGSSDRLPPFSESISEA